MLLSPQDATRAIQRDHRRAERMLERERAEIVDFYKEQRDRRIAAWHARWAMRDEVAVLRAEERARNKTAPAPPSVAESRPQEPVPARLAREILDKPAVRDAEEMLRRVVESATKTVDTKVVQPIAAHSRTMSSGYFALLLAGVFLVPSCGMAALILGFWSLRAGHLRKAFFLFLITGLCTAAVARALRSPLAEQGSPPTAVLLPETLKVGGRTFSGVRYTRHDGRQLDFSHDGGAASVSLADLSPAWQAQLGYDHQRIAVEDARAADAAARAERLRSIEATAILATATVVEAAQDGFVIADLVPHKSGVALAVSNSGCAFLATEVRGLQPGTEVKIKLYRHGERRAAGGWGTREVMPAYTDSAETLLAMAEGGN